METLFIRTNNEFQSKAVRAFAKALELEVGSNQDLMASAISNWIIEGKESGLQSETETLKFIDSLGK